MVTEKQTLSLLFCTLLVSAKFECLKIQNFTLFLKHLLSLIWKMIPSDSKWFKVSFSAQNCLINLIILESVVKRLKRLLGKLVTSKVRNI